MAIRSVGASSTHTTPLSARLDVVLTTKQRLQLPSSPRHRKHEKERERELLFSKSRFQMQSPDPARVPGASLMMPLSCVKNPNSNWSKNICCVIVVYVPVGLPSERVRKHVPLVPFPRPHPLFHPLAATPKSGTLQVVCPSYGRTGTKSMKAALEILGFGPCYHSE